VRGNVSVAIGTSAPIARPRAARSPEVAARDARRAPEHARQPSADTRARRAKRSDLIAHRRVALSSAASRLARGAVSLAARIEQQRRVRRASASSTCAPFRDARGVRACIDVGGGSAGSILARDRVDRGRSNHYTRRA
jgi:hypothetical protein